MIVAISQLVQDFDGSGWLGVLSLALTMVGFIATLINVNRSRKAAVLAESAAAQAVGELKKNRLINDLSAAAVELEEIKRLARSQTWEQLPERLSRVRKHLIGTKTTHPDISSDDKEAIINAIVYFSELEKQLSVDDLTKFKGSKASAALIDYTDTLVEIIARTT